MVPLSTSHRTKKQELLALHQFINWSIAGKIFTSPLYFTKAYLYDILHSDFAQITGCGLVSMNNLGCDRLFIYQLLPCVAGFSMVLPLFSASSLLSRLTSIFLGFAPTFLLLSIGYVLLIV